MATLSRFKKEDINPSNRAYSRVRTTIETAFYGNNTDPIRTLPMAYELARDSAGTIKLSQQVFEPESIGLPDEANVLLFNDGETVGRFAGARIIAGEPGVDEGEIAGVIREAVYNTRYKKMYKTEAYIGLDPDFMVKANLLIPEGFENTLYNWMLNFQYKNVFYNSMYAKSKVIGDEPDIYVLSDPDWQDPRFPHGLAYFDPEHNCAALLGLRYFGEHKKGTLTLAWSIANRNGYVSCHGGMKRIVRKNGEKHVLGVFGLSGSGKSTLTHAKHDDKYAEVTVLHDDAYVISTEDGSSVALEPSYFDKTQDYPLTAKDNKYLITLQNVGATLDNEGRLVAVTEDIRNGNGRAIKSKLWADNRVDKLEDPVDSIIWLMKDSSLPPVLKINDPILASAMGACLTTKRTTAEKILKGVDQNALVFEPYANPFRTYPLGQDYEKFKTLFKERNVNCYIFNTGYFLDQKIPKQVTIGAMEAIVEGRARMMPFGEYDGMEYMVIEGFKPRLDDKEYHKLLTASMESRIQFIESLKEKKGGMDALPQETIDALKKHTNK